MRLDEPSWWYRGGEPALAERLLRPAGALYGAMVERRFRATDPVRSPLPVLCIGNFTAGGTGKTPLARFLLGVLEARDGAPVCLTRGYGGSLGGPLWVDALRHTARDVGDEPLLLARGARVMMARDRRAGLAAIEADGGAGAVIMDDGLQNPSVAKDLTVAVVDAARGFGNGQVIPCGPLRARLDFQLTLVDGIVVMGEDPPDGPSRVFEDLKKRFQGPVLRGRAEPAGDAGWIDGARVVAYAGIANPDRFFQLVARFSPAALVRRSFPDHHAFTEREAEVLLAEAEATGALLVTTEKDLARLSGEEGARARLAARSRTLPIEVAFEERDLLRLYSLIDGMFKGASARA